jgi:L-ascorbate metabolism protein UlaG (beta-lactamase superfamily)
MSLIRAFARDESFLDDVRRHAGSASVKLWWLGQSGYLLGYKNLYILIDPYLSDSLTKKYAGTDKPHVRMSERVVDPARLDFIDVVTSSHNHTDHLDGETLIPLMDANPDIKMIIPEANRKFVTDRLKAPFDFPIGMNDGKRISFEKDGEIIHIDGIPAAHNELDRDEQGHCLYMGYVVSIGGKRIYHSGDTLLFPGMVEQLRNFDLHLAILPINGNDPARKVAGNLSIEEAIQLGRDIGAGLMIPCHYDMFSFNTADPREFARKADEAGLPYRVLRLGEGIEL